MSLLSFGLLVSTLVGLWSLSILFDSTSVYKCLCFAGYVIIVSKLAELWFTSV